MYLFCSEYFFENKNKTKFYCVSVTAQWGSSVVSKAHWHVASGLKPDKSLKDESPMGGQGVKS